MVLVLVDLLRLLVARRVEVRAEMEKGRVNLGLEESTSINTNINISTSMWIIGIDRREYMRGLRCRSLRHRGRQQS